MPEHESHSESTLKVSDRRHFTESGERRPGVEAREFEETLAPKAPAGDGKRKQPATPPAAVAPPPQPTAPTVPAASNQSGPPPAPERLAAREVNFAGLLEQLYLAGMMQLGAEIQPGQGGRVDLEGAGETIDLLGILQQKTHGNLTPQEDRLMNGMLYELRMGYVEVKQASNRVQPAAAMPPPPRARR